ncbi:hypothetical protein [Bosea sp. BK604]|uniref:hypothetical protein n=1 Tax=Bosea sp. BK604 TaxID=2512180 RepID=UPI001043469E|nr:hypothetical protein [Bosea sp. BK604]TCR60565.1 hypothetical protein EV560_11652 [Bosea sp. BK604]
MEADRTTDRFLAWVYAEKKHNSKLRQYILSLAPNADKLLKGGGLHVQQGGETVGNAPDNPFEPGLQTYVRAEGMVDLGLWIRRLLAIERQVCLTAARRAVLASLSATRRAAAPVQMQSIGSLI